ncbi:kinase-like domain-containing protein [Syncephalis fuscata]|nr:kinase-like domain-containing protein [Syncephalis fuscata]
MRSNWLTTIGATGVVVLSVTLSAMAATYYIDENFRTIPVLPPKDTISTSTPFGPNFDFEKTPIPELVPENTEEPFGLSKLKVFEWIKGDRATALADYQGLGMILRCTKHLPEFYNENAAFKVLDARTKQTGEKWKEALRKIPDRIISFVWNKKVGCNGYAHTGFAKSFSQFIQDFKGANRDEVFIELSRQLIGAIALFHEVGLVHGDIKQENIVVTQLHRSLPPEISVIGFHYTRAIESEKASTPPFGYATPESFVSGQQQDSRKADSWALGVTVYTAVTGKMPYGYTYSAKKPMVQWDASEMSKQMQRVYKKKQGAQLPFNVLGMLPSSASRKFDRPLPVEVMDKMKAINVKHKPTWQDTL